jgi:ABC-type transporter Mla maintaining outer membrane lipid asymmetry ATPase subunit MlaF
LVDHDMELVLRICDRIIVLDLGEVIASGTPDMIRNDDAVIRAYLGVPSTEDIDVTPEDIPELHIPKHIQQEVMP